MGELSRRSLLHLSAAAGAAAMSGARAAAQDAGAADTLGFKSTIELARMLREREIGSVELTEYFIGRIERFDGALNAVVVRDFERALAAAAAADEAFARGDDLGPLHGLPITVKEAYDVAGLPTTWGIPPLAQNIAQRDAAVVARLKGAGAHVMGKTNVPLNLADLQSYNDIYGTTNNPWNLERTPGGSSGGAAAALAAGLTGLESGSDIGGSIRLPSHFCGVYGHKPTWGIVSDSGHALPGVEAAADLAVVGPMARSAADLALALDLVAGAGRLDAPGWRLELPPARNASLAGLRVAVWANDEVAPVASEVSDRVQQVADRLAALGATVSDTARPASFTSHDMHYTYLNLLLSYLLAYTPDDVHAQNRAAAAAVDPNDGSWNAVIARAGVIDHRAWMSHHEARTRLRRIWAGFFADWDIVLAPVTTTTAFPHDHAPLQAERTLLIDGVERPYLDQLFWAGLATLGNLPSTSFPTGQTADGLPLGLQAIGAEFSDRTTIAFARLMADEIGGFAGPPGYGD
jgi:amidase